MYIFKNTYMLEIRQLFHKLKLMQPKSQRILIIDSILIGDLKRKRVFCQSESLN